MKVVSFGEILLRLATPGYTRLFQQNSLETSFCGGEANVAVSLSNFGLNSVFVTKLPENDVGYAAVNTMRYFGVDTSKVIYGSGRMGLYYLEKGASQRASRIIYDRAYSAITLAKKQDFNWENIFADADWFHWSGINPALGDNIVEICLQACRAAKKLGLTVSCDLNYRKNLWSSEKANAVMSQLMNYVDVCIGNEEDAEKVLGIKAPNSDIEAGLLNKNGYEYVAEKISREFGCNYVAFTLRQSHSASDNGWSAMIYDRVNEEIHFSKEYQVHIVDRVGSGDSFTAGLIYGLITGQISKDAVEFAAAASCLKHSIEGDFNRVSVEEVMDLLNGSGNGRIKR
ncbi:PfkB family carbohydrate kinase [Priestia megaterium]|uniref:PfkB family carbohydrate kinase n=1 Tax=Priestia megaterium TaxID=1404 RepID=UPI0039B01411